MTCLRAHPPSALLRIAEGVTACRICPSMPPERRRVPGHGTEDALLVLVGEAPGRFGADRTGVPFFGDRSGQLLRELIAELGLDAERDVYITNVVKCNPRDERGNNRAPSRAEIDVCRPHLEAELRLLQPRVVVPLGTLACRVLLGRPLREVRLQPIRQDGRLFFPLYHPSYAASYSYPRDQYRRDFLALRPLLAPLPAAQHEPEAGSHEQEPEDASQRGLAVPRQPIAGRNTPAPPPPDAPARRGDRSVRSD